MSIRCGFHAVGLLQKIAIRACGARKGALPLVTPYAVPRYPWPPLPDGVPYAATQYSERIIKALHF